jgi:hypothetical protein
LSTVVVVLVENVKVLVVVVVGSNSSHALGLGGFLPTNVYRWSFTTPPNEAQ